MATLPTPEENARKVLEIFAHFNLRAGEVLRTNNFLAIAAKWNLRTEDLDDGLKKAEEFGWVESTENGSVRLTEAGFSEM